VVCRRTGRAGNKGWAYTFITSEQFKYAGEIIKALELSESPIPPDVQQLWDSYVAKATAVSHTILHSTTSVYLSLLCNLPMYGIKQYTFTLK
jgi:superfamily II DNA/RNA helicase